MMVVCQFQVLVPHKNKSQKLEKMSRTLTNYKLIVSIDQLANKNLQAATIAAEEQRKDCEQRNMP